MLDEAYRQSEPTETIDLNRLGLDDVSQTGSFVLSGLQNRAW